MHVEARYFPMSFNDQVVGMGVCGSVLKPWLNSRPKYVNFRNPFTVLATIVILFVSVVVVVVQIVFGFQLFQPV